MNRWRVGMMYDAVMTDPLNPIAPQAPIEPPIVGSADIMRGVIRTTVPYVIAFLVTWLGSRGIHLPSDIQAQLATLITVAIGSVWYGVARQLEKINPAFGWLLGAPGAPLYLPSGVTVPNAVEIMPPMEPGA